MGVLCLCIVIAILCLPGRNTKSETDSVIVGTVLILLFWPAYLSFSIFWSCFILNEENI